jgi:hypothetical protein
MSFAHVEAILGRPGDYTSGPTQHDLPNFADTHDPANFWLGGLGPVDKWEGDNGSIWIAFNADGVAFKKFWEVTRQETGVADRSHWRVKQQWKRWFGR